MQVVNLQQTCASMPLSAPLHNLHRKAVHAAHVRAAQQVVAMLLLVRHDLVLHVEQADQLEDTPSNCKAALSGVRLLSAGNAHTGQLWLKRQEGR